MIKFWQIKHVPIRLGLVNGRGKLTLHKEVGAESRVRILPGCKVFSEFIHCSAVVITQYALSLFILEKKKFKKGSWSIKFFYVQHFNGWRVYARGRSSGFSFIFSVHSSRFCNVPRAGE
jgi:hypothetical protein